MKTATRNRKRSKESQEVLERFFTAFDVLKEAKKISAIEICEKLNLGRNNFYDQRYKPTLHTLDFDSLQILVNLGVSADWLLTGNGKMMK